MKSYADTHKKSCATWLKMGAEISTSMSYNVSNLPRSKQNSCFLLCLNVHLFFCFPCIIVWHQYLLETVVVGWYHLCFHNQLVTLSGQFSSRVFPAPVYFSQFQLLSCKFRFSSLHVRVTEIAS